MARKSTKSALEILSDIGSLAYDLQFHSEVEIKRAMDFISLVNAPMFKWLSGVLDQPESPDAVDPAGGQGESGPRA